MSDAEKKVTKPKKSWEFRCDNCGVNTPLPKRARKCPGCKTPIISKKILIGVNQYVEETQEVLQ
jgi:rubrerythrin